MPFGWFKKDKKDKKKEDEEKEEGEKDKDEKSTDDKKDADEKKDGAEGKKDEEGTAGDGDAGGLGASPSENNRENGDGAKESSPPPAANAAPPTPRENGSPSPAMPGGAGAPPQNMQGGPPPVVSTPRSDGSGPTFRSGSQGSMPPPGPGGPYRGGGPPPGMRGKMPPPHMMHHQHHQHAHHQHHQGMMRGGMGGPPPQHQHHHQQQHNQQGGPPPHHHHHQQRFGPPPGRGGGPPMHHQHHQHHHHQQAQSPNAPPGQQRPPPPAAQIPQNAAASPPAVQPQPAPSQPPQEQSLPPAEASQAPPPQQNAADQQAAAPQVSNASFSANQQGSNGSFVAMSEATASQPGSANNRTASQQPQVQAETIADQPQLAASGSQHNLSQSINNLSTASAPQQPQTQPQPQPAPAPAAVSVPPAAADEDEDETTSVQFDPTEDDDGPNFESASDEDEDEEENVSPTSASVSATNPPESPAPTAANDNDEEGAKKKQPSVSVKRGESIMPQPSSVREESVQHQQRQVENESKDGDGSKRGASKQPATVVQPAASSMRRASSDAGEAQPYKNSYTGAKGNLSKKQIVQKFATIVAPQQCFGKIKKFHGVRSLGPIVPSDSPGTVVVAKLVSECGVPEEGKYFPQVNLPKDAIPDENGSPDVNSTYILAEGVTGNMGFAHSETEAKKLLHAHDSCYNSCYVVGQGHILFSESTKKAARRPHQQQDSGHDSTAEDEHGSMVPGRITEFAQITVSWEKFGAANKITTAEVFDQSHRNLIAALLPAQAVAAAANNNNNNNSSGRHHRTGQFQEKTELISEIFSATTKESMSDAINAKSAGVHQAIQTHVRDHQRNMKMNAMNREAITVQFDLMAAAIEAKKKEVLSVLDREAEMFSDGLTKTILEEDHYLTQMNGALQHLSTGSFDEDQVQTIARSLQMPPPSQGTFLSDGDSVMSRASMKNLEHALNAIQTVALSERPTARQRVQQQLSPKRSSRHQQRDEADDDDFYPPDEAQMVPAQYQQLPPQRRAISATGGLRAMTPYRNAPHRNSNLASTRTPIRGRSSALRHASTPAPMNRRALQQEYAAMSAMPPPALDSGYDTPPHQHSAANTPTTPMSPPKRIHLSRDNGTCLFNCPLQPLITKGRIVEWKLRIDDMGDWVGVGVGVGGTLSSWASGATYDIGHLWIVPNNAPRTLKLRVIVGNHGNAKLTIHGKNGHQLDDNRIPHWNITRQSFPQVCFGSVAGKVTMIQAPKIL